MVIDESHAGGTEVHSARHFTKKSQFGTFSGGSGLCVCVRTCDGGASITTKVDGIIKEENTQGPSKKKT